MIITYNNLKSEAYYHCMEYLNDNYDKLPFSTPEEIEEFRQELTDDTSPYLAYEVIDTPTAWAVISDNEFTYDEDIDFSDCSDAYECMIKQANESIKDCLQDGYNEAITDLDNTLNSMYCLAAQREHEGPIEVKVRNTPIYDWFAHSKETQAGLCIYEPGDIRKNLWAASVTLGHTTFTLEIEL